ncbi:hypothetical protein [Nocardioides allogilvus]|uniref:hypothetical protein n=1 Tax=Nocardioides allogilvus TaxID=2072017 RepID=UPI00032EB024|nr:hypothetical protein [Nocardioides allogilvus]EON22071.1 hypothetical protein CF8_4070 [Nocardioides sp. CF8]
MTKQNQNHTRRHPGRATRAALATVAAVAVLALATACGGSSTSSAGDTTPSAGGSAADSSAVLPVQSNPIKNTSTTQALTIDSVLVENNVDASGATADDHLEIAVTNSGSADLSGFEVYYTITDSKTSDTESYYTKLPPSFTVAPGASRVIHFDDTGEADHFPTNQYGLYYTDTNPLDVTVEVSASDSAPQTLTVAKDAGGAEEAD